MTPAPTSKFPAEGSILVVAHPDDEILWFGSVVAEVAQIVICFRNDPAKPELASARDRVLAEHPFKDRIVCLGLDETGAFSHANWPRPEATKFGLRIVKARQIAKAYRLCYQQLEEQLAPMIRDATSVITHNPWGEYGHEEHVLVHRAVTSLAGSEQKDVWYSNHASSWSEDLMRVYLDKSEHQIVGRDVDTGAMQNIADIYRTHGAWTWFEDYQWFGQEYFVRGPLQRVDRPGFGWMFPINMLRLEDRD
ncbi:MAG: PIG-L family deacetylase [Woeseiaceae bacterium]|nr:PIG-L family deacetylase [Woeseiaceae bacterium]